MRWSARLEQNKRENGEFIAGEFKFTHVKVKGEFINNGDPLVFALDKKTRWMSVKDAVELPPKDLPVEKTVNGLTRKQYVESETAKGTPKATVYRRAKELYGTDTANETAARQ